VDMQFCGCIVVDTKSVKERICSVATSLLSTVREKAKVLCFLSLCSHCNHRLVDECFAPMCGR